MGRTPGAEGSPDAESPLSLPLGHRHLAAVTAPAPSEALDPMDALVPPEL